MKVMNKFSLRKATLSDLPLLDQIREEKLPRLHQDRFDGQEKGVGEYLLAFNNEEPVGHVYIRYKDDYDYHNCPILEDLFVKQDKRKLGIGVNIIEEIKEYLRTKGYNEVGLDVETKEDWLKKFYEKCGFRTIGDSHRQSWIEKDTGKKITIDVYHLRVKL